MAAAKTRKNALFKRVTRKAKKGGKVLNVRSKKDTSLFERMIVQGPLTLVFARLEGCGPCERFNKDVWSPLTKLKNRGMNMASIESKMIDNTSLANVPRKFYPTLLLVGPDKKPASFIDTETGEPTNSMPRKNTLEEDRAMLSSLLQNPTTANTIIMKNTNTESPPVNSNTEVIKPYNESTVEENNENLYENDVTRTINNIPVRDSPGRALDNNDSIDYLDTPYPASPFESNNTLIPSLMDTLNRSELSKSNVPDIGADIVKSSDSNINTPNSTILNNELKSSQRGGNVSCLLKAIMKESESLKSILNARPKKPRKKSTVKYR
jgi:hypothetical protein